MLPETAPFPAEQIVALNSIISRTNAEQRTWLSGFLAGYQAANEQYVVACIPEPLRTVYRPRLQGAGVSHRLRGQPGPRCQRPAEAGPRLGDDVSVGPFVSELDEQERFREREETKRLLYVALTRARDRLYLSTSLKDGALSLGRGCLAEVLPESMRSLFRTRRAGNGIACVMDVGTGARYAFTICRDAEELSRGPRRSCRRRTIALPFRPAIAGFRLTRTCPRRVSS